MDSLFEYERQVASAKEDVMLLEPLVKARTASARQRHRYWDALDFLQSCRRKREVELDQILTGQVHETIAQGTSSRWSLLEQVRWTIILMACITGVILASVAVVALAVKLFELLG